MPGTRVHGVVYDGNGKFVPKASLSLFGGHPQRVSDERGAFEFIDVAPGSYKFEVRSKSAGTSLGLVEIPPSASFEWNPVVGKGRVLSGRLHRFGSVSELKEYVDLHSNRPLLILSPLELVHHLTNSELIRTDVLEDNGEVAIVLVRRR